MSRERAIDALIARHLFNAAAIWGPDAMKMATNRHGYYRELPYYSTTWEGLGAVIEAMRARKSWGTMEIRCMRDGRYRAIFWGWRTVYADTAPMAVALAALNTLGVEVPE